MVVLASRAAARAWQCWRLLLQKPTQAEGYPQAISHDRSLGCWRPVKTPILLYLLKVLNSSRLQMWNCLIRSQRCRGPNSPRFGHQASSPSSPIGLPRRSRNSMVWLMRKASAKTWKRCKQSIKLMTRGKTETDDALQKAFHLHWALKDRFEVKKHFVFVPMEVSLKTANPKLEATCAAWISHKKDALCTNVYRFYGATLCLRQFTQKFLDIPTKYQALSSITKLWLNTICQNNRISTQTKDKGFWFSNNSL